MSDTADHIILAVGIEEFCFFWYARWAVLCFSAFEWDWKNTIAFLMQNVASWQTHSKAHSEERFIFNLNCAYKGLGSQSSLPLFSTSGHPRSRDRGFRAQSVCLRRGGSALATDQQNKQWVTSHRKKSCLWAQRSWCLTGRLTRNVTLCSPWGWCLGCRVLHSTWTETQLRG